MESKTIAVDLAKDVFEVAEADVAGRIVSRSRLSRSGFSKFLTTHSVSQIVMEACGSAHFWGRVATDRGHQVKLLPAQYVRAYRRRNKTDRADCGALLEANKNHEILPVPVKTVDSQVVQGLHRIRSQWMRTRTARINAARGLLRELGITLPKGANAALKRIPEATSNEVVPTVLREALMQILEEVRELEARVKGIERELGRVARREPAMVRLQQISGIGILTATAMVASAGDARHFRSGKHMAAWLGLTPRLSASADTRHLGRISKRGDVYVRMLLTHGARSVLASATRLRRIKPHALNPIQRWALQVEQRRGFNKATCALANKLARIAWATWRYERDFDPNYAAAAA